MGVARHSRWMSFLIVVALAAPVALARPARTSAAEPPPTPGQAACARVVRNPHAGLARWLEHCGVVDPRGNPAANARAVVARLALALGLRPDGQDLVVRQAVRTPSGTTIRLDQRYRGVPVYLGQVLIKYDQDGAVNLINNHTLPNLNVNVQPLRAPTKRSASRSRRSRERLSCARPPPPSL